MEIESGDLIYSTKVKDYFNSKYLLPVVLPLWTVLMSVLTLFFAIKGGSHWYIALVPLCFGVVILCFFGSNLFYIKKAFISEKGIGFEGTFFPWKKVTALKEPMLGRRIEVFIQDGNFLTRVHIPMPFYGERYWWPSELFQTTEKLWTEELSKSE